MTDKAAIEALARETSWHITQSENYITFKLGWFDPGPAVTVRWNPDGSVQGAEVTDGDGEPMAEVHTNVVAWVRDQVL